MNRLKAAWEALTGKALIQRIGQPFASYNIINGQWVGIDDNKTSYVTNGYEINDIVYSIVNIITDKVRMPDWGVYKIVDESSLKSYIGLMNRKNLSFDDFKKAIDYKTKALKIIDAGKLTELMKYPNDHQTMQDMMAFASGYKLLMGGSCISGELLNAGANTGKPQSFEVLPYDQVTIIAQREKYPISAIGYKINSIDKTFTKEEVLHDKYDNYKWDVNGSHLYGMAPLKASLRRLSRNNNAVKANDSMLQNGGLPYVLFVNDPRVLTGGASIVDTTAQANAVKEKLSRGPDRWGEPAVSGYAMGKVDVGLNPDELNIIDSEKWDLKRFCAVWGVPPPLLGDGDTSTYNNVKEAEVSLTSRCAMPQLVSKRNQFNRKINTDWGYKGSNYFIDFDQTCFTELQEDVKLKSEWVNPLLAKGLPLNRALDLLGLETIDNPIFDEPWVTAEMGMPFSEWEINEQPNDTNGETDI